MPKWSRTGSRKAATLAPRLRMKKPPRKSEEAFFNIRVLPLYAKKDSCPDGGDFRECAATTPETEADVSAAVSDTAAPLPALRQL